MVGGPEPDRYSFVIARLAHLCIHKQPIVAQCMLGSARSLSAHVVTRNNLVSPCQSAAAVQVAELPLTVRPDAEHPRTPEWGHGEKGPIAV